MSRVRVYIQPLASFGVYSGVWTEVTSDVKLGGIQAVKEQLDGTAFDLGIYRPASFKLALDNTKGKYSDVGELYTIFGAFRRADALVKVTYDPSDIDFGANWSFTGDIVGEEVTVFQGLLNDDSAVMSLPDNTISFSVLGRDSVFDRTLCPSLVGVGPPAMASDVIEHILNQTVITNLLTVDAANINVGSDFEIDEIDELTNKTVKEALSRLLKLSNSVLYIDGDSVIVSDRTATPSSQFSFYGQASTAGPENCSDIENISTGAARVYNFVTWTDSETATALSSSDDTSLTRWGYRKAEVNDKMVTDSGTQQDIIDAIRTEFGSAKKEFELTTPLTLNTLALSILDRVSIDYPELVVSQEDLPLYGVAEYGAAIYPTAVPAFSVLPTDYYKIMGRTVDLAGKKIKFKLRQV